MNKIVFSARIKHPKIDVIASYIGFHNGELCLFECNQNNQTIRMFTLDVNDKSIPQDKLKEAVELKGRAFSQVKVYQHSDFIEFFNVVKNTKCKKQSFWVRRPQEIAA